jgi:hypothetical protein
MLHGGENPPRDHRRGWGRRAGAGGGIREEEEEAEISAARK